MYICLDCGFKFEYHRQYQSEIREHFGTPCREQWCGCPSCSSDNTTELFRCDICGEYIIEDYYRAGDMNICNDCCINKILDGGL